MTFSADSSAMVLFLLLVDFREGLPASWQGMKDGLLGVKDLHAGG